MTGTMGGEQDLSLIIHELRQRLLRGAGAGEAAIEQIALRAPLRGEGVDAQQHAGDRIA
jgi:hypothetical protein